MDVTNEMVIAQEEIFGPVLVVIEYEAEDEAINIANNSPYGLSTDGAWLKEKILQFGASWRTFWMIFGGLLKVVEYSVGSFREDF